MGWMEGWDGGRGWDGVMGWMEGMGWSGRLGEGEGGLTLVSDGRKKDEG